MRAKDRHIKPHFTVNGQIWFAEKTWTRSILSSLNTRAPVCGSDRKVFVA